MSSVLKRIPLTVVSVMLALFVSVTRRERGQRLISLKYVVVVGYTMVFFPVGSSVSIECLIERLNFLAMIDAILLWLRRVACRSHASSSLSANCSEVSEFLVSCHKL